MQEQIRGNGTVSKVCKQSTNHLAEVWLLHVQVDFRNVQMRYRDGLPLVLRGLSVTVSPGSRCGVVGRTGAGKSSLINCLFRLQELCGGSIVIDGIDIAKMGLKDLRTNMAIIPQVCIRLFLSARKYLLRLQYAGLLPAML